MPIYTGDYLRDTQHLSMSEHGAYFRLLMHCWDQKGPAPLDERKLFGICNARSSDEIEAMRRVLSEFFVRMDDGWYNKRITEEVARAEAKSQTYRENGLKSAAARRSMVRGAIAEQRLSNCSTVVGIPNPIPITTKPKTTSASRSSPAVPAGVSEVHWGDWLKVRKAKNRPLTDTALEGVKREAEKAKLTLPQAIQIAAENGWAGFKASWLLQPDVKGWKPGQGQIERPKEWHETASGIQAKGAAFGIFPSDYMLDGDRQDWQAFKAAVLAAASKGVSA